MIHVVRSHEAMLGSLRILAGADATRGHYFAFESETVPAEVPGALDVHSHAAYEESEYVLSGTREIVIGDQRWEGTPGFFALAPRTVQHGMHTIGSVPSRWVHFFSPAGIEAYFLERERLRERGASAAELRALSAHYGVSAHERPGAPAEPAYAVDGAGHADARVLATGQQTRDAYALVERRSLPEHVHAHSDQEEAFYVISGELTIETEDAKLSGSTGTFMLIPRGITHRHVAAPASLLLAVYSPGHAVGHQL